MQELVGLVRQYGGSLGSKKRVTEKGEVMEAWEERV